MSHSIFERLHEISSKGKVIKISRGEIVRDPEGVSLPKVEVPADLEEGEQVPVTIFALTGEQQGEVDAILDKILPPPMKEEIPNLKAGGGMISKTVGWDESDPEYQRKRFAAVLDKEALAVVYGCPEVAVGVPAGDHAGEKAAWLKKNFASSLIAALAAEILNMSYAWEDVDFFSEDESRGPSGEVPEEEAEDSPSSPNIETASSAKTKSGSPGESKDETKSTKKGKRPASGAAT